MYCLHLNPVFDVGWMYSSVRTKQKQFDLAFRFFYWQRFFFFTSLCLPIQTFLFFINLTWLPSQIVSSMYYYFFWFRSLLSFDASRYQYLWFLYLGIRLGSSHRWYDSNWVTTCARWFSSAKLADSPSHKMSGWGTFR